MKYRGQALVEYILVTAMISLSIIGLNSIFIVSLKKYWREFSIIICSALP